MSNQYDKYGIPFTAVLKFSLKSCFFAQTTLVYLKGDWLTNLFRNEKQKWPRDVDTPTWTSHKFEQVVLGGFLAQCFGISGASLRLRVIFSFYLNKHCSFRSFLLKSDFLVKLQLDKKDTLKVTNTDLTEDYFLFSIFLGKLFRTQNSNFLCWHSQTKKIQAIQQRFVTSPN